ncbi:leucine-rich repeat domain-containing protein [Pseudomonas uvaldensis]|uniref:leucine-rich repeat domain-containing protein n=1 Tax=Pseudomonas uvaldensis TaxID=2878385 RepID=UPI001E40E2FC|nr:leucine-rich repeat domain-containing protein [Pseudomonas uvaldensis]MCE0461064.1 leucine-rich repeat domain-containing protein [Pseudomonas uvaldensis]
MSTLDTHVEFIQARLPAWLKKASRPRQERFRTLTRQLQRDSDALNALLIGLTPPEIFAANLLQAQPEVQAWRPVNGSRSAAEAVRRARVKRGPYVTDPSLSVIQAAMRNYPPADALTGGDFDKNGKLYIQGRRGEFTRWGASSDIPTLPITPASFAALCRRVDVGGAYQRLLENHLPRIGTEVPAVAKAYITYARSLLAYDAYEAKLDGRLDETGERLLAHAGVRLHDNVVALGCEIKSLQVLTVPLFGARVYWGLEGDAKGNRPVVLHLPHDVVAPVKQFHSIQAMAAHLTERLRKRSYRESLMRYFPERLRARIGATLHDQVEWEIKDNPNLFQEIHARIEGWREGEPGEGGDSRRVRVPTPHVAWDVGDVRGDHWHDRYREWRAHTLANASALMVPTRDQDWQAWMARLEYWESLAERSLMLAASFIPFCAPVGMAAAAVGGVRLIYEVFEGIQAFNERHAQEGIDHIFNVLFGIAQGAYLGFVGGAVEPMPMRDGSTRLWNGDLTPYRARRLPPVEAEQDAWGVWRTEDEAWVQIEGHYYEVQGRRDAMALRLPADHRGVTPLLEWSRGRGWQWAHRNPLQRNSLELLRNFSETPDELNDDRILIVQRQAGASEDHLRYLQMNGQPMPALLADALDEARNWQWVQQAIGHLRRGESPGALHYQIAHTLADLPGWPGKLALRYRDGLGVHLRGEAAATRILDLSSMDLEQGAWADHILAGLSVDERDRLLGQSTIGPRPAELSDLLAGHWADHLERHAGQLSSAMVRPDELDPLAAPVALAFKSLSRSMANELARQSHGQERLRLREGRVTGSLGKLCAQAQDELRLTRVLRNLERGESSADRDRIVMGLLGDLPELRGKLHLRLFSRELEQPLEMGADGPLKVIRQDGEEYLSFDQEGVELAAVRSLEEALLRAMSDEARNALGLNIWDAARFRKKLLDLALDDRQGLRPYLSLKRLDGGAYSPQWLNGSLGYPLSGRGRLPLLRWRASLAARLEQLFPYYAGDALERLQWSLTEQAEREGISLDDLVARLGNEWATLDTALQQWELFEGVHHPVENEYARADVLFSRQSVAKEIRRAWRREPEPGRDDSELILRLSGWDIGRLPPVSVRFDHIEELTLAHMNLDQDPSDFLRLFPNLDTLRLHGNKLTAVPVAVGEFPSLIELALGANPLNIDANVFAPLLGEDRAINLRELHLSQISSAGDAVVSARMVAAIGRLAELPALRELVWSDNLNFTLEELQAITALPGLQGLDLVRCGLRLDEEGSAFLRAATDLQDLRLSGNNCRELPDLPELTSLTELELANAGLDRVPPLALRVLSRPSSDPIFVDLKGNRITHIQDDLIPALEAMPRENVLGLWLEDNPLPSAQIQLLRALDAEAFRYTVDDWLNIFPDLQRALEAARDDAGGRRFIDWFSGAIRDADAEAPGGLSLGERQRAAAILQFYIGSPALYPELATRLADFDLQLGQLRTRLQARVLDRQPPDIAELELHFLSFESIQRSRLEPQSVPFARFLGDHYSYWNQVLTTRYPNAAQRYAAITRDAYIDWLSDAQDTFNSNDHAPRVGEMTWRPYLGLMSHEWPEGLAIWDRVEEDLVDAFSEPVDPSRWPRVLLDNLARPEAGLPSALEEVPQANGTVWRRVGLEGVADVNWAAGEPVMLTEDQLRRTMAIYRSVKSREIEALVRRLTTELVDPWWPLRPASPAAPTA